MSKSTHKVYGRRAVIEQLRAEESHVEKVVIAQGTHGPVIQEIQDLCRRRSIPVESWEHRRFDKMAGTGVTQGVLALVMGHEYPEWGDWLSQLTANSSPALVVIADEIEDPRNLGAIARSSEGAGAQGLVITAHRSAEVTAVTEKAAGGALAHLPVVRVNSLAQAIKELKDAGVWLVGLDAEAEQTVWEVDLTKPVAIVVGNEGKGLRRLTKELCDFRVKIPMQGQIGSLNVSVATGVTLFEVVRQRRLKRK